MNSDDELDIWREQWKAENSIPSNLRKRVDTEMRSTKRLSMAALSVTIAIGGGTTIWAAHSPSNDTIVLMVATWFLLTAAWTFRFFNNRDNRSPSGLNHAAFLVFSVRHCERKLVAIRFAAVFCACDLIFCLGWIYNHLGEYREPFVLWIFFSSIAIDAIWLSSLMFFAFLAWYRRKLRAELVYLSKLCAHLSVETIAPQCELQLSSSGKQGWRGRVVRGLQRGKMIRKT